MSSRVAIRIECALIQHVHQVVQRHIAADDILDDHHICAFQRDIEILSDLDFAGRRFALTVRGNAHEIDKDVALHGAYQVGHEEHGALKNADHVQVAGGLIG